MGIVSATGRNQLGISTFENFIQTDAAIQYLSQAFHGEALRVEVGIGESDRLGFAFLYRIRAVADGREIARARTCMLFFDYARSRVTRMPESEIELSKKRRGLSR